MKRIITLIITISISTLVYGEDINLICKLDVPKEDEKYTQSFPISLIQKNNGSYSIFKHEKNVEIPDKFINEGKVSNVSITKNKIEFKVFQSIRSNVIGNNNPGYEERSTSISRIDGRFIETVYWKGGFWEGMGSSNPTVLTGICEKRSLNKF